MSINMNIFVPHTMQKPLAWLGKKKWLTFERQDERWIIGTDKSVLQNIGVNEKRRFEKDHWRRVEGLVNTPYHNDKDELFTYAMSRCLAFGPKMFRPNKLQCKAFENTSVDIPFSQYAQPYECLLIEFPEDYRTMKVKEEGLLRCPKYVISWYDRDLQIIMVGCQFDSADDRIVGILSMRPEHDTIETLLSAPVYYEADGSAASDVADFQVAQTFERIAVNLNLLIMYGDRSHTVTPMDRQYWKRYRELKKRYEKNRNKAGLEGLRDWGTGQIDEIAFEEDELEQNIGFKVQMQPSGPPEATPGTHASPKPHWRRGHWAQQPYGPARSLRKPILRQPVFVIGRAYAGAEIDLEKTSVVYGQEGEHYQP